MSAAFALKQRLRAELKTAMQARAADEAALLRALIATLDNAEAVPLPDAKSSAPSRPFGDPAGEVARRDLDIAQVEALLAHEEAERLAAAADYERHGRPEEAERLRAQVERIASYRA